MKELAGNLITREGEILLLYREDEGWWDVPGGKVEDGESPTDTAKREAEEIGVGVELERPFFSGEFQHRDTVFLWHGYVAEIEEGEPSVEGEKFSEMEWFSGDELDELELAPNLEMVLPALRKL